MANTRKIESHEMTNDANPPHGREQREGSLKHHGDQLEDAARKSTPSDHASTPEDPAKLYPPGTKVNQDDSDFGGQIDLETPT